MLRLFLLPLFCFFAASYSPAFGLQLTFGVVTGTNLTDDVRAGQQVFGGAILPSGETSSQTVIIDPGDRKFILGLKLEYALRGNWAIEFNALHRRLESTSTSVLSPVLQLPNGITLSQFGPFTRLLTPWEFPLVAKYRIPAGKTHPFVEAGPSFRPAGTGTGLSHVGFAAGGGVEWQAAGFRFAPTLRYTRWLPTNQVNVGGPLLNQVEFLLGIDRPSTATGITAVGRRMSLGGIAGVGLGTDFRPQASCCQTPESNSGILGVMLEGSLTEAFSVEVDGLYRPLHGVFSGFGGSERFAHLTWEFPVLLKYRFKTKSRLTPFFEVGPSFRAEGNLNLRSVSHYGATAAAGVETRFRWLKIAPQVRYTHWGGTTGGDVGQTWPNQAQVLVSFGF